MNRKEILRIKVCELITVAIASCNNAKYLHKCLNSVVSQSYKNVEIIIVDDGSADDSKRILEKYKADNIHIFLKENEGLSSVRELALSKCSGNYICFIDADDYIDDCYVEILYKRIKSSNADICVCGTNYIDENGEVLLSASNAYSYNKSYEVTVCKELLIANYEKLLREFLMSDSWNKMYRTEFLHNSSVHFGMKKGLNGSDLCFNHKLMLHSPKISVTDNRLYYHIMHPVSATHRKGKKLYDSAKSFFIQIYNEAKRVGFNDELNEQLALLYWIFVRNAIQDLYYENKKSPKELACATKEILDDCEIMIDKYGIKDKVQLLTKSLMTFRCLVIRNARLLLFFYCKMRDLAEKNT